LATCELTLTIFNGTPSTVFRLVASQGINPFPDIILPQTSSPPESAGSPFQVKGFVTYADQNGGTFTVDFYIPALGSNSFSISSNPAGRYQGHFVGSTGGWTVTTTAVIMPGSGGADEIALRLAKEAERRGVGVEEVLADIRSQAREALSRSRP